MKLAMAIAGIYSIHLLLTFIEAGCLGSARAANCTETSEIWKTIIGIVFIISAIGIAYVDKLSNSAIEAAKPPSDH